MSDIMEKLLAEEKEAEKLMYDNSEESLEEAPTLDESEEDEAQATDSFDLDDDEQDVEQPKPKRENWKKRYIGYKSATDKTISELRNANSELSSDIQELREQNYNLITKVNELQVATQGEDDPFKDVFTQEDEDMLGPEAIAAMKKAALAAKGKQDDSKVEMLQKELQEIKLKEQERLRQTAEQVHETKMTNMRVKLGSMIPNFESLDNDANFGEWLNDLDTHSDAIRMDLFTKAVRSYDVANVARFYKEYLEANKKPESFVEDYITPEGDAVESRNPDGFRTKKRYRISDYEKFMDDVTRGKYRGREKEAKKLEMMFDKAFMENRMYE